MLTQCLLVELLLNLTFRYKGDKYIFYIFNHTKSSFCTFKKQKSAQRRLKQLHIR